MPTNKSSYIYNRGTAPNTRAAVSQKNKLYGYTVGANGWEQLGAINEFGYDESRSVDPVRGVGYGDMIAELVPGVTEPMKLTLNKTLIYTANIFQVVGYNSGIDGLVRSLRHHRWPFDIKQELVFSELACQYDGPGSGVEAASVQEDPSGGTNPGTPIRQVMALITFFEGCWFDSFSATFSSDSAIIVENSSVSVTDTVDGRSQYGEFINSGLAPVDPLSPNKGASRRFANNVQGF